MIEVMDFPLKILIITFLIRKNNTRFPILHNVFPSERIPDPIAPQALSAPPANTFVDGTKPVFLLFLP